MATCAACGSTIMFGGKQHGELRFCNDSCLQQGQVAILLAQVPEALAFERAKQLQNGLCPVCHGSGPVEVHFSYRCWSALVVTTWKARPRLSCKRCARSRALGDFLFSGFLGWWGIPWGLLVTPWYLIRNLVVLVTGVRRGAPSPALLLQARLALVNEQAASAQGQARAVGS